MQSSYVSTLISDIPWAPARIVRGTKMIDISVYYFYWLSECVSPLRRVDANHPLGAYLEQFIYARSVLSGFQDEQWLAAEFPRTALAAKELISWIEDAAGINLDTETTPMDEFRQSIPELNVRHLRDSVTAFAATLRDEALRSYVLKIEDQRCLSSHSLVERIENCFSAEAWAVIGDEAKREFEESGKCLALERCTGAGFHALRGVECVIRQLLDEHNARPNKRDWGTYIESLKRVGIDAKVTSVLDNIRALERNPLMHPEDWLDIDEAIAIFTIANTAITRLAAEIRKKQVAKAATAP